jgi:hypothetical protein
MKRISKYQALKAPPTRTPETVPPEGIITGLLISALFWEIVIIFFLF